MYDHGHSIGSIDHLEAGIDHLISLIDEIVARHPVWDIVQQTRAGIAAWEVGINKVFRSVSSAPCFHLTNNGKFQPRKH